MLTNILFLKTKFFFKTTESVARQHVYKSIRKKWAANRLNLWSASEDPLKSRAEIIDNVPDGVPPDQWFYFVDYQYKDSTKMAQTGQMPGRAQIYIATHKYEDGVYVNEEAKEICVLGKEHSGRVRCLGLGPIPSRVFKQVRPRFGGTSSSSTEGSCSSQCQHNHNQMMNAHNQMMNAFKAYMIMKEGTIPEQFAGFFASPSTVSPPTPSDADSGPLSPMDARRSCGDSNSSGNR
ncbi:hypothetical protein A4A49_22555 [Nicotiana attenuata]|uniref:Uncharacterized protein n=1 Tax=Nicotiana attenuata TaxID=49451 RepID=A0A1J6KFG2_NICAT|nr:hypothetical protein A4A49_22555 [Nicotiana attenuata]